MKKEKINVNKNCGPFNGNGIIMTDDRTNVYVGNCSHISSKLIVNQDYNKEGERVKPFNFQANCCDYLYFICWSNHNGLNAFLAELNGNNQIFTGHPDWEVFATGKTKGVNSRITVTEINQELEKACKKGWKKPFVGPVNNGDNGLFSQFSDINENARFIWYDSGKDFDTSPQRIPFGGFNHDEFLIFRIPVKSLFPKSCSNCDCQNCTCDCDCDCGCDGCNENAVAQNSELVQRASAKKHIHSHNSLGNQKPFPLSNCQNLIGSNINIVPSVYLQWGESTTDVIENHDTEVMYITVCNPYKDISFNRFRITKINLVDAPDYPQQARIIPDRFITYDCIKPCSCKTREFTFLTRDQFGQYTGSRNLEIEYCWDDITLAKNAAYGTAIFPIEIIKDEE